MNWVNAVTKESKEDALKRKIGSVSNHLTETFLNVPMIPVSLLSGGKDSTTTTSISLVSWKNAVRKNPKLKTIPFMIAYSNTRCENPIKDDYLKKLIDIFAAYANKHDFKLEVVIARPSVVSSWQGKIVGGYATQWDVRLGTGNGCASDWKINAIKRALSPYEKIAKELGLSFVRILGSRYQESKSRANNLNKVGANEFELITYKGQTKLYPIYSWTETDVWDYLLYCEENEGSVIEGTSDGFYNTLQFYNQLNGGECSAGINEGSSCSGSRDGCWNCFASNKEYIDEGLYETNPHLAILGEYRRFMIANNIDAFNRSYIPHTPSNYTRYRASSHSGAYLLDILRIGLTIQVREQERAAIEKQRVVDGLHLEPSKARTKPEFIIFEPQDIAFIDYSWMIRGIQIEPHAALKAYVDIVFNGARYDIPKNYKRNTESEALKPSTLGHLFYEGLNTNNVDDIELDEEMERSWTFAPESEFISMFSNKELLQKWSENNCYVSGASRWLKSGLITPPKHQLETIKRRMAWVKNIYRLGLNENAFNGGKLG